MNNVRITSLVSLFWLVIVSSAAADVGNPKRGGEIYRACVACHSLEPGAHLTGPSLANLWKKSAGKKEDYSRYSEELGSVQFEWNEDTLNAWLDNPQAMVPGTYMQFQGISDLQDRTDIIAFLEVAMSADGYANASEQELAPESYLRGQQPPMLSDSPPRSQITSIRHCRDGYFIDTADGTNSVHWEKNIRIKVDSQSTGPHPESPVIIQSGMRGDRFSVIFHSIDEISNFIKKQC